MKAPIGLPKAHNSAGFGFSVGGGTKPSSNDEPDAAPAGFRGWPRKVRINQLLAIGISTGPKQRQKVSVCGYNRKKPTAHISVRF